MAFAFGFPEDVTDLIYSMRDWRWEKVRDGGKTPSARCFDNIMVVVGGVHMYQIESDIEESDFGEIVDYPLMDESAWIELLNLNGDHWPPLRHIKLRHCDGRATAKFRRLQKQRDRRVNETWWQCEPCAALE